MSSDGVVGVFDSGVGGLSVLRAIRAQLPDESLLYVADSAYAPYGERTPQQICDRAEAITRFLVAQGAKAVVVACNTATAYAAEHLRTLFALPIVAMEPAVKPAVHGTRSGTVGVMATVATLASPRYAALLARYGGQARVVAQACPGLVEQVERGAWDSPETREMVRRYLAPLLAAGADRLVLGCTHYPFLHQLIAELAGPTVGILDTGPAVAAQLARQLEQHGLARATDSAAAQPRFVTSGDPAAVAAVMTRLWGGPVAVEAWREDPVPA